MFKLYLGPVRSAKTSALIMKYDLLTSQGEKALVFKPKCDDRRGDTVVKTYKGFEIPAISVESAYDMAKYVFDSDGKVQAKYIFIDEIQFFDSNIYDVILRFIGLGLEIYGSGLNSTYELKPWKTISLVTPLAHTIEICHGKCAVCHDESTCSGVASNYIPKKEVDIGDHFIPLCLRCFMKQSSRL